MKEDKMSDEILDNPDGESVRKPYFAWLEGIIVLGHLALIGIALQSAYNVGISIGDLFEELIITTIASCSIFYVYKCRQCTMNQKIITPIRMLKALRIGSFLSALFLLLVAMFSFDFQQEVFVYEHLYNLFLLFTFLTTGVVQLCYTFVIHKNIL